MQELSISTKNCIVQKDGALLIVTLNRPEAKNAFTPEMLLGMYKAWRMLDQEDEVKFGAFGEVQQELLQEREDQILDLTDTLDKCKLRILELEKIVADLK